jgi:hypothetical protein
MGPSARRPPAVALRLAQDNDNVGTDNDQGCAGQKAVLALPHLGQVSGGAG